MYLTRFAWIVVPFVFLLILGSVFLTFARNPERESFISPDGFVILEGDFREIQQPGISIESPVTQLSHSSVYSISPSNIQLERPVRVVFYLPFVANPEEQQVLFYDEDLQVWQVIDSIADRSDDSITIEINKLGRFTVANISEVVVDVPERMMEELFSQAPPAAVGYRLSIGYQVEDREVILQLPGGEDAGGCDGILQRGNGYQYSRTSDILPAKVNGVDVDIVLVGIVQWYTSSIGGCSEGEVLVSQEDFVL